MVGSFLITNFTFMRGNQNSITRRLKQESHRKLRTFKMISGKNGFVQLLLNNGQKTPRDEIRITSAKNPLSF